MKNPHLYPVWLMALTLLLSACALGDNQNPASGNTSSAPDQDLSALFQEYFDEGLELNPIQATFMGLRQYNHLWVNMLGADFRQRRHDYRQRWLRRFAAINTEGLTGSDRTSLAVVRYQLEQQLADEAYPDHLLPVSQFFSIPNFMVQLGSGMSAQPFRNLTDYENWLRRAEGIPVILDQAIANMREGMARGITQPRVIMEKVLPQLAAQLHENIEDSLFWQPLENLPESIKPRDRETLRRKYRELIGAKLLPAYRRLHDFIRDEYLPASRPSIAWSDLPDGEAWYRNKIRAHTTTDLDAAEIHRFGRREVARIRGEMNRVREQVGFEGSLQDFFTYLQTEPRFYFDDPEDLLQGYRDLQKVINARLPALFDITPRADYEVRAIEAFRAASAAGASYTPGTPDGSRPGVFYVNTHNLRAQPKFVMETLSIHEASPGHHFQISIQQETPDLPMFRRFGGFTVFSEGWALYAESLGRELGLFRDPYQYYGRLSDEMLRAMRLVVDTGIHAKGWSRQKAIDYMLENSSMAESDVIAEVERYIAIPGQALAYKIGQREISRLRRTAEASLGERFDIRAFHRLILTGGAVPMAILRQRVNEWIEAQNEN